MVEVERWAALHKSESQQQVVTEPIMADTLSQAFLGQAPGLGDRTTATTPAPSVLIFCKGKESLMSLHLKAINSASSHVPSTIRSVLGP
jgi:hypothetical protein